MAEIEESVLTNAVYSCETPLKNKHQPTEHSSCDPWAWILDDKKAP